MAEKPARNSEDKLYQACLDACIEAIGKIPVNLRQTRVLPSIGQNNNSLDDPTSALASTPAPTNKPTHTPKPTTVKFASTIEQANSPPAQHEPAKSLISPPPTPRKAHSPQPLRSPSPTATMDRAPLHGAPPHGRVPPHRASARPSPPAYGNQDARGNFTVAPAATAGGSGSFKLKKAAVRIVGAAAPAPPPSTPNRVAAPAPATTTASSPAPGSVKAKAKEPERVEPASPTKPLPSVADQTDSSVPQSAHESELNDLFARLSTGVISAPPASAKAASTSTVGPAKSEFSFEEPSPGEEKASVPETSTTTLSPPSTKTKASPSIAPVAQKKADSPKVVVKIEEGEDVPRTDDAPQKEVEQLYLRKAAEYVSALPGGSNVSVQTIKTVSSKLRSTYAPDVKLTTDEIEKLKARYAFAVVNYINNVLKQSAKPITREAVKKALEDCDGNLLALYGALASKGHVALDDIQSVVGFCKTILDVLPKAEPVVALAATQTKSATTADSKTASQDPMETLKAWPTQEKRENPAMHRACILKGVSGVKSINELQALVWGGRLESIAMPSPGSDFAVVKFLTPEACEKYFKATENGIQVQGDLKKAIILVEKQPGPSSINDVIRNCINGDASRCVRALDAEEDWSDMLLMKLARGKGTMKREVDRIKRGKTARGRYDIEFRFANIYHALNFKKVLADDDDWESCTISYAPDPCETARGVHYKDEDE